METQNSYCRRRASASTWILFAMLVGMVAYSYMPRLVCGPVGAKVGIANAAVDRNGTIDKALNAFLRDMGRYPSTDEGLQILFQMKESINDGRFNGPYLKGSCLERCKDPWGNYYEYRFPGEHNSEGYDLWSHGRNRENENGKDSSDDINNWR